MNDNVLAVVNATSRLALGGLAQRLVQDGLLDETSIQDAIHALDENPFQSMSIEFVVIEDDKLETA